MVQAAQHEGVVLMDASRIERSIRRIAFQLAEEYHHHPAVTLLGINTRGFAVASRLHGIMGTLLPNPCLVCQIMVEDGPIRTNADPMALDSRTVIVVDDVIFSGRTMQQAVLYVMQNHQADIVRCVALVDRGHRKFPVEPQFTGLVSPTKLLEHVHVDLIPDAESDCVLLYPDAELHR